MNPQFDSSGRGFEAQLGALAPRGLDHGQVMYAAGKAAAAAEATAAVARRVRRWQAASGVASLIAASLAVALALPGGSTASSDGAPVVAATQPTGPATSGETTLATTPVPIGHARAWNVRQFRTTNASMLKAGMSPLEMRQVLLRDDRLPQDSATRAIPAGEPMTPRSLDLFFEHQRFRSNSST